VAAVLYQNQERVEESWRKWNRRTILEKEALGPIQTKMAELE
jgi:hypothetical protein